MPTLVELVPHDPNWALIFSAIEQRLRIALGSCVVAVDHIGSTAVPGLDAKPIIDIDVTLSRNTDIERAATDLVNAGFEPRGNRYDDDVWAFLPRNTDPQVRVYLCAPQNLTHISRILFRDYLRQTPDAAGAYSVLKRKLAQRFPYDGDRYTSEKSQFIAEIVSKAKQDRETR